MKLLTYTTTFVLIVAFVNISSPKETLAHGEGGLSLSATSTTKGGLAHIVDVDYGDIVIEADRIGRFNFSLFADTERTKPVDFTDMWVLIERDDGDKVGKTVFAGGIAKQAFGGNGFSFVFPESGKYTLNIRYNNATDDIFGTTVAEAEFTLEVLRSEEENKFKFSLEFWSGLVGGLLITLLGMSPFILGRKKS